MPRSTRALCVVAVLLTVIPAVPVHAQGVQITPFAGGRFFGGLRDYTGASIDVDASVSFGGFLTFMQSPDMGFELGYSRQDSDLNLSVPFEGRERFDVKVDQWAFGVQRHFPRTGEALTPFAGGLVGLTHMSSSDGDESQTKFMLGASGGAKFLRPQSLLGLRLEGRGYFTFAGGGGAGIGCGFGGCSFGFSSDAFFQLDLIAGVILNFGRGSRR
ncbi:MAG: hypothetical protein P8188_08260 [Gemmatimonadota bacterium]|jgi:hypothetical protein